MFMLPSESHAKIGVFVVQCTCEFPYCLDKFIVHCIIHCQYMWILIPALILSNQSYKKLVFVNILNVF